MGSYHAISNCRTFVKKAFEVLKKEPECSDKNQLKFYEEMTHREKKEDKKIKTGTNAIKATAGIATVTVATAIIAKKITSDLKKEKEIKENEDSSSQ